MVLPRSNKIKIKIFIKSQMAENGPPLGTILGNLGLNTMKFCKEFNEFTKDLPDYFKLIVKMTINENKTYEYKVFLPTVGYFISLLKQEEELLINGKKKINYFISINEVFKLAKFKHPTLRFEQSIPIIMGTLASANIKIKEKNI